MMTLADEILSQALLNPESRHQWLFGDSKPQTRRARAIHKLLTKSGIASDLKPWPYGGFQLTFPCRDYQRATAIADACYVGESWWPTKSKTKVA
jgi:hypothetical protein